MFPSLTVLFPDRFGTVARPEPDFNTPGLGKLYTDAALRLGPRSNRFIEQLVHILGYNDEAVAWAIDAAVSSKTEDEVIAIIASLISKYTDQWKLLFHVVLPLGAAISIADVARLAYKTNDADFILEGADDQLTEDYALFMTNLGLMGFPKQWNHSSDPGRQLYPGVHNALAEYPGADGWPRQPFRTIVENSSLCRLIWVLKVHRVPDVINELVRLALRQAQEPYIFWSLNLVLMQFTREYLARMLASSLFIGFTDGSATAVLRVLLSYVTDQAQIQYLQHQLDDSTESRGPDVLRVRFPLTPSQSPRTRYIAVSSQDDPLVDAFLSEPDRVVQRAPHPRYPVTPMPSSSYRNVVARAEEDPLAEFFAITNVPQRVSRGQTSSESPESPVSSRAHEAFPPSPEFS